MTSPTKNLATIKKQAGAIKKFRTALEKIAACESYHPDDVVAIARRALDDNYDAAIKSKIEARMVELEDRMVEVIENLDYRVGWQCAERGEPEPYLVPTIHEAQEYLRTQQRGWNDYHTQRD